MQQMHGVQKWMLYSYTRDYINANQCLVFNTEHKKQGTDVYNDQDILSSTVLFNVILSLLVCVEYAAILTDIIMEVLIN